MDYKKSKKVKKITLAKEVVLPQGVSATWANNTLTLKSGAVELKRQFIAPAVLIKIETGKIVLSCAAKKRFKTVMCAFTAHVKNMVKGVQNPFVYKLKICSSHFPMNVAVDKDELVVKNYLGEKFPRRIKLKKGVKIQVKGDEIVVESSDIELAGSLASDIEHKIGIHDKDRRIYQDGIYITVKPE